MKASHPNQGRNPDEENNRIDCLVSVFKIYLLAFGTVYAWKVIKAAILFITAVY